MDPDVVLIRKVVKEVIEKLEELQKKVKDCPAPELIPEGEYTVQLLSVSDKGIASAKISYPKKYSGLRISFPVWRLFPVVVNIRHREQYFAREDGGPRTFLDVAPSTLNP